jgi:hypothetical protein
MHIKTLCGIRSIPNPSSDVVAEAASIPDPQTAWVQSTMTEAKIQALVDRGLLRPKAEVEWKAVAGEEFTTEDVNEQVIFTSFFEHGFNLPVGTSSAVYCTTTSWSWYILFPTPFLQFRPSFTSVRCN